MKFNIACLLFLFVLSTYSLFSQTYSATLIDAKTKVPIPYATVQAGDNNGVVTNKEGYFSISLQTPTTKVLTISCMGYISKSIVLTDFKNGEVITLEEQINELDAVYLNKEQPNIDSIMARVNRNLKTNYAPTNKQYTVFNRSANFMKFEDLNFDIDKASGMRKSKLAKANKSLDSLAQVIKASNIASYTDFAADYYFNSFKDKKLEVHKATLMMDQSKDFSLETIEHKSKTLLLKYLDTTKTYKLKSGLFKIEDSLSLGEELEKSKKSKQQLSTSSLTHKINSSILNGYSYSGSFLQKLVNQELYNFELKDYSYYQDEFVYVINFKPRKRKAKYSGTLYVSDTDYGVLRADYKLADGKQGEKFNLRLLLGVKYVELGDKGVVLFNKSDSLGYTVKYTSKERSHYMYVHRPLKFIENSTQRNKIAFDFLIEGAMVEKRETLVLNTQALNPNTYKTVEEKKQVPYTLLQAYDPSLWKDQNILAPIEEMKRFNTETKVKSLN